MSDLRCEVIRVSWNNVMSAVETFTGTHFYFFFLLSDGHGVIRLFSEQIHRNQIVLKEGHLLVHLWIIFNTGAFLESLKLLLGHHFALQEVLIAMQVEH